MYNLLQEDTQFEIKIEVNNDTNPQKQASSKFSEMSVNLEYDQIQFNTNNT